MITLAILMPIYAWIFFLMRRNDKIHKFRVRLLDQVSLCSKVDIKYGRPFTWRYDCLNQATYNAMVWKFWRKFDSFYPDKSFLDPNATRARRPAPKQPAGFQW